MTGFDPTAPERDTDRDEPEQFEDNVVPPTGPADDEDTAEAPASEDDPATD